MKSNFVFTILSLAGLFFSCQYIGLQKYSIGIENGAEDFMLYYMKFYNKNALTFLATGSYAMIFILSVISLIKKRVLKKNIKPYFVFATVIMVSTINHGFMIRRLYLAGTVEILSTYYILLGINLSLYLLTLFYLKRPFATTHSNLLDDNLSS